MAKVDPVDSRELEDLLAETRRRGRRRVTRRRVLAGAAGLLVASAVAVPAFLAAGSGPRDQIRTIGPSANATSTTTPGDGAEPTPTQIVAVEAFGGRIAVISAASGKIVRVLAATQAGNPTLAVTPDGTDVYFTNVRPPARGECSSLVRGEVNEVARVSIRGGPVTVVGPGLSPAVSPNGRLLAYSRNSTNPCAGNNDELVLVDLKSGARRTFTSRHSSSLFHLENLSWAPDSVHLGYNQYSAASPTSPKLIDTATAGTLDDAMPIPHAANSDWAGFLGGTGDAVGVTPHDGSHANPAAIVQLDGTTGAVTRTLFTLPGGLAVGNVFYGPEDTLHADRSGRDVLAIGLLPVNAPIRHGALYRWHDGDRRPTLVADQIWAAAWIEPHRRS
jgi:hypothetical protein